MFLDSKTIIELSRSRPSKAFSHRQWISHIPWREGEYELCIENIDSAGLEALGDIMWTGYLEDGTDLGFITSLSWDCELSLKSIPKFESILSKLRPSNLILKGHNRSIARFLSRYSVAMSKVESLELNLSEYDTTKDNRFVLECVNSEIPNLSRLHIGNIIDFDGITRNTKYFNTTLHPDLTHIILSASPHYNVYASLYTMSQLLDTFRLEHRLKYLHIQSSLKPGLAKNWIKPFCEIAESIFLETTDARFGYFYLPAESDVLILNHIETSKRLPRKLRKAIRQDNITVFKERKLFKEPLGSSVGKVFDMYSPAYCSTVKTYSSHLKDSEDATNHVIYPLAKSMITGEYSLHEAFSLITGGSSGRSSKFI